MARTDALGLFWQDVAEVKTPKVEKPKRTPPERTWESEDYLPNLEEARVFNVPLFTDQELWQAAHAKETLLFDVECYYNYFLVAFISVESGKVILFERTMEETFNTDKLKWVMSNFCVIGFNSRNYDIPIISIAVAGKNCVQLKVATNEIIVEQLRPQDVLRRHKVKALKPNHIDLIELAPLHQSLKMCAGRLHAPRMQDLPFPPDKVLNADQIVVTRWYCINDLHNTGLLRAALLKQLQLRESMGVEYGQDLRSRSDAQIAEAVIADAVGKLNGVRPSPPVVVPGTRYTYKVPAFLQFQSPLMQWALELVRNTPFVVSEDGAVGMPPELKNLKLRIAGGEYRMGIGGLHSSEQTVAHFADAHTLLLDRDVISYYPRIILNQRLYPHHIGPNFLRVYEQLVNKRLAAKAANNDVVTNALKIVINGSYGKLGSMYSTLYAPDLLIQVTMTGQLALLMLIERLELQGISVVSANTDGIVIKCKVEAEPVLLAIVKQWEQDTNFETEETKYRALYSRDVNNYIAVKPNGTTKAKGAYGKSGLAKNPAGQISMDAVYALLTDGTPVDHTVRGCRDITKFLSVRTVNGGAVKVRESGNTYLGKAIRWYYGAGETGEIVYARSGNKVPRSEGAIPLMDLPKEFPADMDFDWYIREADKILVEIGYAK